MYDGEYDNKWILENADKYDSFSKMHAEYVESHKNHKVKYATFYSHCVRKLNLPKKKRKFDDDWILTNFGKCTTTRELYEEYNRTHPEHVKTWQNFYSHCFVLGLRREFTNEHDAWLREYYPTHGIKETQKAFFEKFGISKSYHSIKDRMTMLGIRRSGIHENCGKKRPDGTVRRGKYGYEIKINGKWKPRSHSIVGEVPSDGMVLHLDGNTENDSKDNLIVISRSMYGKMSGNRFLSKDPDAIMAGLMCCELMDAINESKGD